MTGWKVPETRSARCDAASGRRRRLLGCISTSELRRVFREMLQGRVRLPRLVIVQHRLPVREGATLDILPADAHRRAVHEQRRPRQRLRVSPIDSAIGHERGTTTLEYPRELWQR